MFDADGVVIQSQMFSQKYAHEFDVDISELDRFFSTDFQECLVGRSDLKIAIEPWLEKWRWQKSVDEFLEYWFRSEHNVDLALVETIGELRASRMKCVLATNQEKYRLEYMKREMGFKSIFDKIYSSNFIGFKKPATEYYDYVLNDLKADPNDVIFYDDSQENIDSAKVLGINANLYRKGQKLEMVLR